MAQINTFLDMLAIPRGNKAQQQLFIDKYIKPLKPIIDNYGNCFVFVGDNAQCLFTSHVDTVHSPKCESVPVYVDKSVRFAMVDKFKQKNVGANCLGADCTSGISIMLEMIGQGITGAYAFFLDEESGLLGSNHFAKAYSSDALPSELDGKFKSIDHVISFDRYGTDSVISHQSGENTASLAFCNELANRINRAGGFNFKPDDGGSYTDSYALRHIFKNCTNLSVGYYSQHTPSERQDLKFLEKITKVYCSIDWQDLPVGDRINEAYELYKEYDEIEYILDDVRDLLLSRPEVINEMYEFLDKHFAIDELEGEDDPFYVRDH
jgi:hypothetical protein